MAKTFTLAAAVGANIASARRTAGMSQEALGQAVKAHLGTSLSRQSVYQIEHGGRALQVAHVAAFALALNTTVPALLDPGTHDVQLDDDGPTLNPRQARPVLNPSPEREVLEAVRASLQDALASLSQAAR